MCYEIIDYVSKDTINEKELFPDLEIGRIAASLMRGDFIESINGDEYEVKKITIKRNHNSFGSFYDYIREIQIEKY